MAGRRRIDGRVLLVCVVVPRVRVYVCVRVTAIRILDIFSFPRFRPPLPCTPCDLILKNKKKKETGRIINKGKKKTSQRKSAKKKREVRKKRARERIEFQCGDARECCRVLPIDDRTNVI